MCAFPKSISVEHKTDVYLTLWETVKLLSKVIISIYVPPAVYVSCICVTSLPTLGIASFNFGDRTIFHCGEICISSTANEAEPPFISLWTLDILFCEATVDTFCSLKKISVSLSLIEF